MKRYNYIHSQKVSWVVAEYEWRKEGGNLFSVSRWRFVTPVSEPLSALSRVISLCIGMFIFLLRTPDPGSWSVSVPGWPPATPDPVTPGRWSGRGGGCDPVTIIRELMAISGVRGGDKLSIIVFPVWSGMFCGFWVGLGSVREEKWIIANFLSTVTWQLTLENWEIEPKEVREPGSLSCAWVFPYFTSQRWAETGDRKWNPLDAGMKKG